jgi:membrane protein
LPVNHLGFFRVRPRAAQQSSLRLIAWVQGWLERRADSRIGRLALAWFRAYFAASHNSAAAFTLYTFLSVLPACLAVLALFDAAGGNANALAEHLVDHLNLHGSSADMVRTTFGTTSQNALAATGAAVVGFFVWGIGLGKIFQDVYSRAWDVRAGSLAYQMRFAIWFAVLTGLLCGQATFAAKLRAEGWLVFVPVWLAVALAFWIWTPSFLLHRRVGIAALAPGALVCAIAVGGATAVSPLFLGTWMNVDAAFFGPFGVLVALLMWALVLAGISVACAVFSPVYSEWRLAERSARPASLDVRRVV